MSPDYKDALRRFDGSFLRLRKAFLELWIALRELQERSSEPVRLPRLDREKEAEASDVDSALRFLAGVDELLGEIDPIEDRDVVAAKASVMRHADVLFEAIADLDRLAGGEDL